MLYTVHIILNETDASMKSIMKLMTSGDLRLAMHRNDISFFEEIDWSNRELTCREIESGIMNKSVLMDGIANSSNDAVLILLDATPFINNYLDLIDYYGNNPLILSASKGWNYVGKNRDNKAPHSAVIKKLVEKGANINAVDKYGRTALHYACFHRDIEAIQYLIEHGAIYNFKDNNGLSPLDCLFFDFNTVKQILDKATGGEMDNQDPTYFLDNKRFTSSFDITPLVDLLVEKEPVKSAVIPVKNESKDNHPKSLIKLFESGSLCRAVEHNDATFLDDIDWSDEDLTCRELEAGRMYASTLLCGIANSANDAVLKLLDSSPYILKYVNLLDKDNGTRPLILSVVNGWNASEIDFPNSSVTKKLLEKGAQINDVDKYGRTALHYACLRQDKDAVEYLLSQGAKKDIKDLGGLVPLAYTFLDYSQASKILKSVKYGCHRDTLNLNRNLFSEKNKAVLVELLLTENAIKPSSASIKKESKESSLSEGLEANSVFNSKKSKDSLPGTFKGPKF